MKLRTAFIILFLSFRCLSLIGQKSNIDSIVKALSIMPDDTNKIKTLHNLAGEMLSSGQNEQALKYLLQGYVICRQERFYKGVVQYFHKIGVVLATTGNYEKALVIFNINLKICVALHDKKNIAQSLNNIALIYFRQGNYPFALDYHLKSLEISEKLNDLPGISRSLVNIGTVYLDQGNYPKALESYLKALPIKEKLSEKAGIAGLQNNIGIIYKNQKEFSKALDYYLKSLKIREELGQKENIAQSLTNIGTIYSFRGLENIRKALDFYYRALRIEQEIGDKRSIALSLNNIGSMYETIGDSALAAGNSNIAATNFKIAKEMFMKSAELREEMGDKQGITEALKNTASIYFRNSEFKKALDLSLKALTIAREIGSMEDILSAEKNISEVYEKLSAAGRQKPEYMKNALEHFKAYITARDSIMNEDNIKKITRLESGYEWEVKETKIKSENEKIQAVAAAESRRQKIIIFFVFCCLLFAGVIALVIYRNFLKTKMANIRITRQKRLIESQKQDITDSIEYASNIQQAMLPSDEEMKSLLSECFLLYKPKAIVSGDFYYLTPLPPLHYGEGETGEEERGVLLCTADCTGHGVPGAFMSMLCTALLNEAVTDKGITSPEKIFEEVRKGIIAALKQKGKMGETKDGMDATLISLLFGNVEMLHATSLRAVCANNPVYIVSNSALYVMPPDRFPVGVYEGELKPFKLHSAPLQKGDMIYTMTDGFEDQLGGGPPQSNGRGEEGTPIYGKKFKSKRLKELLVTIAARPVKEQKEILEKTFEEWKGNGEQTDDVTLIGIRV